jgi:integrase
MYMIQNLLNNCKRITKNNKPLKPSYINIIKNRLHVVLQYAVELEWLDKNPCDFCKVISKIHPKDNYVFSITNIKEIYSCLKQENIYDDIIKFQLLTGLRIGETLMLTVNDINFKENYIDINKTVTKINSKNVIGTPKTKNAYRRIYINQPIKKIIDRNLKTHLLFSMNDTYVNKTNIRLRLKQVLKDTPYCHLTLHDLRHINSSLLLYNDGDLKNISSHLGHSSIRVTSDIYLHTTQEANAKLSLNSESIFNELAK